jgi:hypothetical protein
MLQYNCAIAILPLLLVVIRCAQCAKRQHAIVVSRDHPRCRHGWRDAGLRPMPASTLDAISLPLSLPRLVHNIHSFFNRTSVSVLISNRPPQHKYLLLSPSKRSSSLLMITSGSTRSSRIPCRVLSCTVRVLSLPPTQFLLVTVTWSRTFHQSIARKAVSWRRATAF